MAITTLGSVKTITGITDNDDLIEALIPMVEDDYLRIRNKPFDTGQGLRVISGASSAGYIYLTIDGIIYSLEVESGDNVYSVARKIYERLKYKLKLMVKGDEVIFLTPYQVDFEDISTGVEVESPTVATIYPDGSELTAINMIAYRIENKLNQGIKSESLGDHSVSYGDLSDGYPKSLQSGIKRFVKFK